jgi:UDP-N-acetylglucosamine:LPS N-acetylglucosamine transferase
VNPDDHASFPTDPKHVLLVASSGGHLAQLLALRPWWEQRARSWVTFDTPDARSQLSDESVTWAYFPTTRNAPNLLRNTALAARRLPALDPDLVVSNGAAVAVPFFVMARILGIPTVYIEVFDRLESRTVTGRLCRPISDLFLVQWEEQAPMYPGSRVVGTLM